MRPHLAAPLCLLAAACTSNSGAPYTPSYSQARPMPALPQQTVPLAPGKLSPAEQQSLAAASPRGPSTSGRTAVANANRNSLVKPTSADMQGSTWVINRHNPNVIYAWYISGDHASTALLPEGERWSPNGMVGGDTRDFIVSVTYAGPRPAITVVPKRVDGESNLELRGNLQLFTDGGAYSFLLLPGQTSVNLIDIGTSSDSRPKIANHGQTPAGLEPSGDYTPLQVAGMEDEPLPAWAPSSAWADSTKLVLSWPGPLPQLPALFAGMEGEQMIRYRTIANPQTGGMHIVTDRRVTEAELRIAQQTVVISTDPDAISSGMALPPGESWYDARPRAQEMLAPPSSNDPLARGPQPVDWY